MRYLTEVIITLDRSMYTIESVPTLFERMIVLIKLLAILWALLPCLFTPIALAKMMTITMTHIATNLFESLSEIVLGIVSEILLPNVVAV